MDVELGTIIWGNRFKQLRSNKKEAIIIDRHKNMLKCCNNNIN